MLEGRRDAFVEPYFRHAQPDQLVVILKALRPLGADNSVFAGHPDTSTQTPPFEQGVLVRRLRWKRFFGTASRPRKYTEGLRLSAVNLRQESGRRLI
jgi:hypothetical protein